MQMDDEDKGVTLMDTLGGKQNISIINGSGVYALVFGRKLPAAKDAIAFLAYNCS